MILEQLSHSSKLKHVDDQRRVISRILRVYMKFPLSILDFPLGGGALMDHNIQKTILIITLIKITYPSPSFVPYLYPYQKKTCSVSPLFFTWCICSAHLYLLSLWTFLEICSYFQRARTWKNTQILTQMQ